MISLMMSLRRLDFYLLLLILVTILGTILIVRHLDSRISSAMDTLGDLEHRISALESVGKVSDLRHQQSNKTTDHEHEWSSWCRSAEQMYTWTKSCNSCKDTQVLSGDLGIWVYLDGEN